MEYLNNPRPFQQFLHSPEHQQLSRIIENSSCIVLISLNYSEKCCFIKFVFNSISDGFEAF